MREIGVEDIPALDGITVFPTQIEGYGLSEPHWHPNAGEIDYCISGQAEVGSGPEGRPNVRHRPRRRGLSR